MKVALVKIGGRGEWLVPLSLACLQAYLKEHSISVDVLDLHGTYGYEALVEMPTAQIYSARIVLLHTDLPVILAALDVLAREGDVDFDEDPLPDIIADHALRMFETPGESKARYIAKLQHAKQLVAKVKGSYDLVGFTVNYMNTVEAAFASAILKREEPSVRVIWGGPSVIQSPEMAQLFIVREVCDALVNGEGEAPLLEMARGKDPTQVAGVSTLDSLSQNRHEHRIPSQVNLNDLPTPDWTGISLEPYGGMASVYSSRGCTDRCRFCAEWQLFGNRFRRRDVDKLVDDIEHTVHHFKARYLIFADSTLNHDAAYFERFCDKLAERNLGIPMASHFRADFSFDQALKARKAGFDDAWLGVEALNDETLNTMNKGLSASHNIQAMENLARAGVHVVAGLVVGFGTEAHEAHNYLAVLSAIEYLSKQRVDGADGKRVSLPLRFRPAQWFLAPSSIDYRKRPTGSTKAWRPLLCESKNKPALEELAREIETIPFEYNRQVPDAMVFSIIKGIQDATTQAGFSPGGMREHILKEAKAEFRGAAWKQVQQAASVAHTG